MYVVRKELQLLTLGPLCGNALIARRKAVATGKDPCESHLVHQSLMSALILSPVSSVKLIVP